MVASDSQTASSRRSSPSSRRYGETSCQRSQILPSQHRQRWRRDRRLLAASWVGRLTAMPFAAARPEPVHDRPDGADGGGGRARCARKLRSHRRRRRRLRQPVAARWLLLGQPGRALTASPEPTPAPWLTAGPDAAATATLASCERGARRRATSRVVVCSARLTLARARSSLRHPRSGHVPSYAEASLFVTCMRQESGIYAYVPRMCSNVLLHTYTAETGRERPAPPQ